MKQEDLRRRCSAPTICKATNAVDSLTELRQWMQETEAFGVPHFGEFGFRLKCYRDRLATAFRNEETGCRVRGDSAKHAECRKELEALSRQHVQFLDELENMAIKLQQHDPPYESWQEATRQFAEIQLEIDRHKGRERQLIEAMRVDVSTGHLPQL